MKPPHVEGTAFAWHRDSKWCDTADVEYSPYLSFWCALDDVGEENGTLYIKPYPTCGIVAHSDVTASNSNNSPRREGKNRGGKQDEIQRKGGGEDGDVHLTASMLYDPMPASASCEEGVPMTLSAGSVVILSDRVLHCSGSNISDKPRRVWMPQFSRRPLRRRLAGSDSELVSFAVPL